MKRTETDSKIVETTTNRDDRIAEESFVVTHFVAHHAIAFDTAHCMFDAYTEGGNPAIGTLLQGI